jgi:hypothetical protein
MDVDEDDLEIKLEFDNTDTFVVVNGVKVARAATKARRRRRPGFPWSPVGGCSTGAVARFPSSTHPRGCSEARSKGRGWTC